MLLSAVLDSILGDWNLKIFSIPNWTYSIGIKNEIGHTVITPVAALTPASPNIAVAASVTSAVAPMFTTLST